MPRLSHSIAGQLRAMQVSSTAVFLLVEGPLTDPCFYAQLIESLPAPHHRWEIQLAQQFSAGGGGGKETLIELFLYARNNNALVSNIGGNRTVLVFLLDKDIDDISHSKKRSLHVIYTEHYDVDSYIFLNGNLLMGASTASSIIPSRLHTLLNDAPSWCRHAAVLWREWVAFCLLMKKENLRCEANYSVPSRLQVRPAGPLNPTLLSTLVNNLAAQTRLSTADIMSKHCASLKRVNRYYTNGMHSRIFKGKWYAHILADDIDQIMAGQPYDKNGLENRLPCAVAATLDFSKPWADNLRNAIRRVIALL